MENKNLQEMQQELDAAKWNDGLVSGNDPCGTYDYCAKCDKTVEYPCAQAKIATETVAEPAKEPVKEVVKETVKTENQTAKKPASDKVVRVRKSKPKKAE